MMHLNNLDYSLKKPTFHPVLETKPNGNIASLLCFSSIVATIAGFVATGCSPQQKLEGNTSLATEVNPDSREKEPILILITISPEARVKASVRDTPMLLTQGEWAEYSIEIENTAGITAPLFIESEQILSSANDMSRDRWMELQLEPNRPLSGNLIEYRTLKIRSRDAGIRTAILNFNAGQGTQDLGFRSDVLVAFKIKTK